MSVCTPAQAEIPDDPDGEPSGDPEIPEGYCRVFSLDGETYDIPQPSGSRQLPVEDIIKKDDNGKLIVYITLQDGKGLAVSTTDPDKSVSSEYVDGTVALGQDMKVLLDFPALLEPALGGIQEDVWYYLDLPDELVPQEEEGALNQLIDPTDPMELLHSGKIRAFGGIYTNGDSYRLLFSFVDTADQIGISASFQYTVKISEELEYSHTYNNVAFGGAGELSFTTAAKQAVVNSSYSLSLSGLWEESHNTGMSQGSPNTKINWTASLADNSQDNEGNAIPSIQTALTLDMASNPNPGQAAGGHGLVSYHEEYENGSSPYSVWVIYKGSDTEVQLTPFYRPGSGWCFYDAGKSGPSYSGEHIVTIDYAPDSCVMSSDSFIAQKLTVTFGNVPSSGAVPVEDVIHWRIGFTSQAYNNVELSEINYMLSGSLAGANSDGSALEASGSVSRRYGEPNISYYSIFQNPNRAFASLPDSLTSTVKITQNGSSGHGG